MTEFRPETYRLRLTTLSPIHIGCGEVYEPFHYIVKEKKTTTFFDPNTGDRKNISEDPRLVHIFQSESLLKESKESVSQVVNQMFQKGNGIAASFEIQKILKAKYIEKNGKVDKQEITVDETFVQHYEESRKKIESGDLREFNNFQINRTSFQSLSKLPYIPGSSLKGSLRTVLLNHLREKMQPSFRLSPTEKGKKAYDSVILGTSKIDEDPFQKLQISDLIAIPATERRKNPTPRSIGYAVNKKKAGHSRNELGNQGIPQLVEIVEPYAYFEGSLTLNKPLVNSSGDWKLKTLPEFDTILLSLQTFFNNRMEEEKVQYFPNQAEHPALKEYKVYLSNYQKAGKTPPNHTLVRLGRYCGAEAMTDEIHRKISIPQKRPPVHDANSGTTRFLFFKKRNENGEGQPFGWALLEFYPI